MLLAYSGIPPVPFASVGTGISELNQDRMETSTGLIYSFKSSNMLCVRLIWTDEIQRVLSRNTLYGASNRVQYRCWSKSNTLQ